MLDFEFVKHHVELGPARGPVSEEFPLSLAVEDSVHGLDLGPEQSGDQGLVLL